MNLNTIAFGKRLIIPPNNHQDNTNLVAEINSELMHFGYILTEDAFNALSKSDYSFIRTWINDIINYLKTRMADGDIWIPLHANFPESVMDKSVCELYMIAILHYWTNGQWMPAESVAKEYSYEYTEFKPIKHGDISKFTDIFTSLVAVNQSITPADMKVIIWFADNYSRSDLITLMPKRIPFKENLATLAAKGLPVPIKTPSDVLRIAHFMSHKHTDLVIPPLKTKQARKGWQLNPERMSRKFKSFTYSERIQLLALLEECAYPMEMVRNYNQWIRLGERLHPGDFKHRFPKALAAFTKLRRTKVRSWYSYVDSAFSKSFKEGVNKLAERPGEFARRLDWLLRSSPKGMKNHVLKTFQSLGIKISNKVLFELMTHFRERNTSRPRSVFVKGARSRIVLSTLPPMSQDLIDEIEDTIWTIFFKKFELLEPLGAVWIDEELKKIPAPVNMRTMSDALVVAVRGQRTPFTIEKKVLRLYTHWTNGTDIDLSCEFGMKNGSRTSVCAFHDLGGTSGVYHSGDVIPSTRGNHAEYIDIDVKKCPYDYALLTVNSYRSIPFTKLNVVCGMMERDNHIKNKTWYPKTVVNSMALKSNATTVIAFLFDLRTMEWIPVDEDAQGIPVTRGNKINHIIKMIAELPKVSAWHILKMHAEARGHIVTDVEEADILFKFDDFKESYESILAYMI